LQPQEPSHGKGKPDPHAYVAGADEGEVRAEKRGPTDAAPTSNFELCLFTYDGNLPGRNIGPARVVGPTLDIRNELVSLNVDTVGL
jgi:hypothetical protein